MMIHMINIIHDMRKMEHGWHRWDWFSQIRLHPSNPL